MNLIVHITMLLLAAVPAAASSSAQAVPIEGLKPADVWANAETQGFTTSESHVEGQFRWVSELKKQDRRFRVEVTSRKADTVEVISVAAVNLGEKATADVARGCLLYFSTLPYRGAEPEKAKKWVNDHLGDHGAETTIGGVRFQLFGQAGGRSLILRMSST